MLYNGNVLVIDDDPTIRKYLEKRLTYSGYYVVTAEHGVDGLNKAKEKEFDAIIVDIRMPVMDGITTLKEIKKLSKSVEVIVMTAFSSEETTIHCLKEGAFDFMAKPLDSIELETIVRRAIESHDTKRRNELLNECLKVTYMEMESFKETLEQKYEDLNQELSMCKSRNKGIMSNILFPIIIINQSGEIVLLNSTAGSVFNYSSPEVIGKNIEMLIAEEKRKETLKKMTGSFARSFSVIFVKKDGKNFEATVSTSAIDGGEIALVFRIVSQ